MGDDTHVARLMLIAGMAVAGWGGLVAGLLYLASRRSGARPPPTVSLQRPAWNGVAVLAAFGLFIMFGWLAAGIQALLTSAGFFRTIYGPDFPLELPASPNPEQKAAATIRYLWSTAIAFPIQIVAIVLLPRALKVANPLHSHGWQRAVVAGYLTWLIVTPAAFCVFVLASIAHRQLTGQDPEKHPLTALGDQAGTLEWGMFIMQTVLIAPMVEEWVFRGILLPWLAQKRPVPPETAFTIQPTRRPLLVLCIAVAVGVIFTFGTAWLGRPDEVRRAFSTDLLGAVATYLIPAVFFLALIPFDFILPRFRWIRRRLRIRSTQQVRAIWASSALFAAVHAQVWPSPVPLVVLAIGLGYLYLRTRSVVGPMVVHGMFNAVSAVYLLLGGPA